MADRFPLIIDSVDQQIQELSSGDNLDLASSGVVNANLVHSSGVNVGVVTATKFKGDGSELDHLPATGGTLEATASGTLVDGSTVIVNTDGTVSVVAQGGSASPNIGSPTEFTPNRCDFMATAFVPPTDQVVIVYRDNDNSGYGTAVVGTVSGSSITFGTPSVFFSDYRFKCRGLIYDTTTDNLILHFGDTIFSGWDGTDRLRSAKISGNSLTWDSSNGQWGYEFYGNYCRVGDIDFDPTTGLFQTVTRRDQGYSSAEYSVNQFSVSADGSTYTRHGSDEIANINHGGHIKSTPKIVTDGANSRFFVIYTNNSLQGVVKVGTITGSSGSYGMSFGSESLFESGSTNANGEVQYQPDDFSAVYDSHHDKLVIMYRDLGDSYKTKIIVGTPSATSVSFGSAQDFSPTGVVNSNVNNFDMVFDSNTNKIIISYRNANNDVGNIVKAEVSDSGNSITVESSPLVIDSSSGTKYHNKLAYDTNSNKAIVSYFNFNNDTARSAVYSPTSFTTNLTEENYIGISDGAYSDGETATIQIAGSVDDAQSGLTPGQQYYVQNDGTLSETAGSPSVLAGTAVAATKLIIG